jgi:hypothetical protein
LADQAFRLIGLHDPLVETAAAARAIAKLDMAMGMVEVMMIDWHTTFLTHITLKRKSISAIVTVCFAS